MRIRVEQVKGTMTRGFKRWAAWMEKQGFYVMVGLCLLVIIGSALWTRQPSTEVSPESVAVGEAADFQQKLSDVINPATPAPTPAPTATPPPRWMRPVSGAVSRGFSPNELIYQPTMDAWAVHAAVDAACGINEPVLSPTSGKVYTVINDARYGPSVAIKLEDGSILTLMGYKSITVAVGDNVTAGQSTGTAGGLMAAEASDATHMHIMWEKNGVTLDPSLMWD